jgi:hypothetical protein
MTLYWDINGIFNEVFRGYSWDSYEPLIKTGKFRDLNCRYLPYNPYIRPISADPGCARGSAKRKRIF